MLFRAGWNAAQVQRHLGHSDVGFTLRMCIHLLDDDVPEPNIIGTFTMGADMTIEEPEREIAEALR